MEQNFEQSIPNPETQAAVSIEALPEQLGFVETEELSLIHGVLVETAIAGDVEGARELVTQYNILGEQVVEQHTGESFPRAQIGLLIAIALIRREAGAHDRYIEDIDDAILYASNMGYEDIVSVLETEETL